MANTIACGQTRTGNLTPDDCVIEFDNSFFDAWFFAGTSGQTVTINMSSTEVDSYLLLAVPTATWRWRTTTAARARTDARIVYTLDSAATGR